MSIVCRPHINLSQQKGSFLETTSEEKQIPDFLEENKTGKGGKLVFRKGHRVGRPAGSKNKTRMVAEALMGYNGNKIVKEIIRKALDPSDKDQALMLKACLERILPPVREMTVKHEKNTSINVVVEGIQQYVREVVDAEIIEDLDEEELDVPSSVPEDSYADIEGEEDAVDEEG